MKNLQRIRKENGLSQSQLSFKSGVNMTNICFYESGERDINKAQVNHVYALAKALNCNIEDILELDTIEKKKEG